MPADDVNERLGIEGGGYVSLRFDAGCDAQAEKDGSKAGNVDVLGSA